MRQKIPTGIEGGLSGVLQVRRHPSVPIIFVIGMSSKDMVHVLVLLYNAVPIFWEDQSKERMVFWHFWQDGVFWGDRLVGNMSTPDWKGKDGRN